MSFVKKISLKTSLVLFVLSCIILYFSVKFFYYSEYPKFFNDIVLNYSKEYSIDKNLIFSIIRSESSFKQNSKSVVGAKGLMQITDDTYIWLKSKMNIRNNINVEDLYIPDENIKYGTFFLKILFEEFENLDLVLAAYHAGINNVKKWLTECKNNEGNFTIPFKDTKSYVEKVKDTYLIYNKLYN